MHFICLFLFVLSADDDEIKNILDFTSAVTRVLSLVVFSCKKNVLFTTFIV